MKLPYTSRLWLDWETKSSRPITAGSNVYAEDSAPLLLAWAYEDEDVAAWECEYEPMPPRLLKLLQDPTVELVFHNVDFDRTQMVAWGFQDRYGIDLSPLRFLCTMVWARMCKYPGSLDALCKAFGLPESHAKKDGNALIRLFCIPRADGSYVTKEQRPTEWEAFVTYAKADIISMRECAKRLPKVFSATERHLFAFTTLMNDRGIKIDRELAVSATLDAARWKAEFRKEGADVAKDLTDEDDFNVGSQKAMLELLRGFGIVLEDMRLGTVERFLESSAADDIPQQIRTLLQLRMKSNKASVAKYSAVLKNACEDDALRGLVSFYAAGTGRDAGRRFQPQNLPRPVYVGEKMKSLSMEHACQIIKTGMSPFHVENPLQLMSDCVRGVLVARPGKRLCTADLSSIEGRLLPWMAGEKWKVDYYRALDEGRVKYDGYQLAYAVAFGADPATVTKAQRTLGKPIELATGYQGGVGALISFAAVYRIDLADMARKAYEAAEPTLLAECAGSYDWYETKRLTYGLPRETFIGLLYIVKAWRNKHPATVALWARCEDAFRNAIKHPETEFDACTGTTMFSMKGWVFAKLPSGRLLSYPNARIEEDGSKNGRCVFSGVNPITKKFSTIYTYAGKLCENLDQAIARDVLFWNIPNVENAGYEILLRVHDEVITETPDDDKFNGDSLARILATPHRWCADLPLNAAGETLYRYQK